MSNDLQKPHDQRGVVVQHTQEFSGPLPPPGILKKFDEVVPGAAERIIKMAEEQSAHRRELEKRVINSDVARSKWGQILGFIISIVGLITAALIAIYGSPAVGGVIGFSTIASLVWVFMYGAKTRSEERIEKKS